MDWKKYFKGKKITVMGLGTLGRGVGDVQFLSKAGAELIVTDLKKAEDLKESLEALSGFSNITFVLGEHRLEDFQNRDLILKSAGVPLSSPFIAEARKQGISIEMSTALFARFTPATIVGVTGTRGKSTVTHMVYEVLQLAFQGTEKKVFLGGNVRGVSTLSYLPEANKGDVAVLELDSWQLQGFGEDKISPQFAVFTTFFPDHLNYYDGDMKEYLNDKANIFKYQHDSDFLIVGEQAFPVIEAAGVPIQGRKVVVTSADVPSDWKLQIPGEHNRYNAAIALKALEAMGISREFIRKGLEHFKGIPGRLELVKTYKGINIYNDTNATTPDATLAGLQALDETSGPKSIILIMGGADKKLEMKKLIEALPKYCKKTILLPGSGTDKLIEELNGSVEMEQVVSLEQAVAMALKNAASGDVVLFSPAFASFGLFRNEYDRGEQFVKLIDQL